MPKKTKIFISFFFVFIFYFLFQFSFAKYVIDDIQTVANLNIDRCKPNIELFDVTSSNSPYPTFANKTHQITGYIKLTEKNIVKNNLSANAIQILVANQLISPHFEKFALISDNNAEKIYEFSFTNTLGDGSLSFVIPKGIVEDKSGLVNEKKIFSTSICIDNTAPIGNFTELTSNNQKSIAQMTINEPVQKIANWEISTNNQVLSKEFSLAISYPLPIVDYAQNSSEVLVDIKTATNLIVEYGTYDSYSKQTIVSGGKITAPNTISSHSICKSETIFMRLAGEIDPSILQGRAYVYTHWKDGAYGVCNYSELTYYHGYNPTISSEWIDSTSRNWLYYGGKLFTQLGGRGLNIPNKTASNVKIPIPEDIAKQYLYGISAIQFRLKNSSEYSIVYQAYVKDVGWLKSSFDGQENYYQYDKPISAFRMNLVPKTERTYLVNFWNRAVGTSSID